MAQAKILWTVLPYGVVENGVHAGKRRVSVVVSPRLKPERRAENRMGTFEEFVCFPDTILNGARFSAEIDGKIIPMELISKPDRVLWSKLFNKDTRVDEFKFMDMSAVNLHSFSVRDILGSIKEHYSNAADSPFELPKLLPWKDADDSIKNKLIDAGTKIEEIDDEKGAVKYKVHPGFDRFFDKAFKRPGFGMKVPAASPTSDSKYLPTTENTELNVINSDWKAHGGMFNSEFEFNLFLVDSFYNRLDDKSNYLRRPDFDDENIPKLPDVPAFDFHKIINSLSAYPELMRRLGLLLDFVLLESNPIVRPPKQPQSIADLEIKLTQGRIQLKIDWRIDWASVPTEHVTPNTAFLSAPGRFLTCPRTNEIKDGLLNLEKANDRYSKDNLVTGGIPGSMYDLYQVDPDGTALKTVDTVINEQNMVAGHINNNLDNSNITYTTGERQGLAALRSAGLGVSQHKRAVAVAADAAAAKAKNDAIESGNGNSVTLFAEDVLSGYRVDVAPVPNVQDPGRWRSLCARDGDYSLLETGEILNIAPDEGYVTGPSTTSAITDSGTSKDHYLHESMFRWTGWSLVTPRPGLIIEAKDEVGSQVQYEVPSDFEDADAFDDGCGVRVRFETAKGTLPRLRYGQLYRFRARIVDLAGNSLALDDPALENFTGASDAVGYWRFEPIDPPVAVHCERVSEGESLERMVIRSNFDVGAEEYLISSPFTQFSTYPEPQDFTYTAENERHFVPPKSSQLQCETHGLFDNYFRGDHNAIKESYAVAARDEYTLYDLPNSEIVTPSAIADIATSTEAPQLPGDENPYGDRMAGGQYLINGEAQIYTPWLPDGAAQGVAIWAIPGRTLPGVINETVLGESCEIKRVMHPYGKDRSFFVILVKHLGEWPDLHGFRLILSEVSPRLGPSQFRDDDMPDWNETARTLKLFVPKGWIVRLRYSSYANENLIDSFGLLKWIEDEKGIDKRKTARELALHGVNWLFSPYRELTLVHATQQPVFQPTFNGNSLLELDRKRGSHDVTFGQHTFITLHGPSTGKFEVEANWVEWVDDPAKDAPELVKSKGQLGEIMLEENHPDYVKLNDAIENHRKIADPQNKNPDPLRGNVHALGDTRFRLVQYRIRATTRFSEYFPPAFFDYDSEVHTQEYIQGLTTRLGDPARDFERLSLPAGYPNYLDDAGAAMVPSPIGSNEYSRVLASAPPADPKVLYVVPTMRWGEQRFGGRLDVTRKGNGLRVWLDRPWFSSGDGELLGVVLYNTVDLDTIPEEFSHYVTQWGADPFWESPKKTKPNIHLTDFPARVYTEQLKLQEKFAVSDPRVTIVGHRVHFDYDKKLWYCDIELSDQIANYMPFVRLALVRYQPNALLDSSFSAKLSKVVQTDFAQVLPNRRLSVDIGGANTTLSLSGPGPMSGPISQDDTHMPAQSHNSTQAALAYYFRKRRTSRNRVELVYQTRDPAINSDLAWTDHTVVSNTEANPTTDDEQFWSETIDSKYLGYVSMAPVNPGNLGTVDLPKSNASSLSPVLGSINTDTLKNTTRAEVTLTDSTAVKNTRELISNDRLANLSAFAVGSSDIAAKDSAALSGGAAQAVQQGRLNRLVLREFERFYSDDVRYETNERIIEERLVFSYVIAEY